VAIAVVQSRRRPTKEQHRIVTSVGLLNEGHLHASLRAHYLRPGDRTEVNVDGFIVDILRDGLIIEIQTANFSSIARKMRALVEGHRLRLVYPVAADRWIIKLPRGDGEGTTRRKSPKHAGVLDVFEELVSCPQLIVHPNFELDVVLVEEETVWRFDRARGWRRRGWVTVERRLLGVREIVPFRCAGDYVAMLPAALPGEFLTSHLATAIGRPRHVAQKMAYCLRHAGLIDRVGARGNAIVYRAAVSGPEPAQARRRR
jgi:hypothetical protein